MIFQKLALKLIELLPNRKSTIHPSEKLNFPKVSDSTRQKSFAVAKKIMANYDENMFSRETKNVVILGSNAAGRCESQNEKMENCSS